MRCFLAPDFCIVTSTKLSVWVWYSIPRDVYGLRNVVAETRKHLKNTTHLIKVMIEILVFDKIIHLEYQQIQSSIFWSFLYKLYGPFHVYERTKYQTESMEKSWSLKKKSLDNDPFITFYMICQRTAIFVFIDFSSTVFFRT